jgi:hypothetical protein
MKDSNGYIRRGSGKSAVACRAVDPATAPAGRTFGLCGAPDPATAEDDAGDLRELVRVLRYEIAPALWEIARAVRIAEALDAPPFSPCAAPRRSRKGKAVRS